jgi:hypothetical protein
VPPRLAALAAHAATPAAAAVDETAVESPMPGPPPRTGDPIPVTAGAAGAAERREARRRLRVDDLPPAERAAFLQRFPAPAPASRGGAGTGGGLRSGTGSGDGRGRAHRAGSR